MLTFDAHLDLSLNALGGFNRDLRLPVHEIRRREAGMTGKGRAGGTTAFPEMRQGKVGICVATQLAGCMPGVSPSPTPAPANPDRSSPAKSTNPGT